MNEIVVADIGGTNSRFAIAELFGGEPHVGEIRRYATAEHGGLEEVWQRFAADAGRPLPQAAGLAVAGALGSGAVKLANSHWTIRPAGLAERLGLDRLTLVNDFGAIAFAVDHLPDTEFEAIGGPRTGRPERGVISVIGPGTGLGAAMIVRGSGGHVIIETEGGHIGFAPVDEVERQIVDRLAARHGRVSAERLVSGPGLHDIFAALEPQRSPGTDAELWARATSGTDEAAAAALDRLCMCFGSVAGDLALAHGAAALVLAGHLSQRIADRLKSELFQERFRSKGRYRAKMEAMPILLCRHQDAGLYGAAVAFHREHCR